MTAAVPNDPQRCLTCGYDLSATVPVNDVYLCPECGDATSLTEACADPFARIRPALWKATHVSLIAVTICLGWMILFGPHFGLMLVPVIAAAAGPTAITIAVRRTTRRLHRRYLWIALAITMVTDFFLIGSLMIIGTLLIAMAHS